MTILKLDRTSQMATVELSRSEVGKISNLMAQGKVTWENRAHFFLLYELLSHGAIDTCASQIVKDLLNEAQEKGNDHERT